MDKNSSSLEYSPRCWQNTTQVKKCSARNLICGSKRKCTSYSVEKAGTSCGKYMLGHGQARSLGYISIFHGGTQGSIPVACQGRKSAGCCQYSMGLRDVGHSIRQAFFRD
jgi:hypothetical protein